MNQERSEMPPTKSSTYAYEAHTEKHTAGGCQVTLSRARLESGDLLL
jgi:hypothetical protein